MNKIFNRIIGLVILTGLVASCHKIDVKVTSELTAETFPQTEAQLNSAMGPVYAALRGSYATDYFFLQRPEGIVTPVLFEDGKQC